MNFFSWLTITDELFALEPQYNSVKDDWGQVSNKLRSLKLRNTRLDHGGRHFDFGRASQIT